MAKIVFYLLMLTAFVAVPMLLFCSGCSPEFPRRPVLMVFTADWCGQCQQDKPAISAIISTGRVEVRIIDVDSDPDAAQAYSVPRLPYYMVFIDGRKVWDGGSVNVVYNYVKGPR